MVKQRLPWVNTSLEKALQMSRLSWINGVTLTAMCVWVDTWAQFCQRCARVIFEKVRITPFYTLQEDTAVVQVQLCCKAEVYHTAFLQLAHSTSQVRVCCALNLSQCDDDTTARERFSAGQVLLQQLLHRLKVPTNNCQKKKRSRIETASWSWFSTSSPPAFIFMSLPGASDPHWPLQCWIAPLGSKQHM